MSECYYEAHTAAMKELEGIKRVVDYLEQKLYAAEFSSGPTFEENLERKLKDIHRGD